MQSQPSKFTSISKNYKNFKDLQISPTKPKKKRPPNIQKLNQKSKQVAPYKILTQLKSLIKIFKTNYHYETNNQHRKPLNSEEELLCVRQLGEINRLLTNLGNEFIEYAVNVEDFSIFVDIFARISLNKQICVCVIERVMEAYIYSKIDLTKNSNLQKQEEEQQQKFTKLLTKFIDLSQFCLQLNTNKESIMYRLLVQVLQKIRKWCNLLKNPTYFQIVNKIDCIFESI